MSARSALTVVGGLLVICASSALAQVVAIDGAAQKVAVHDLATGTLAIEFDGTLLDELGWGVYESSEGDDSQGDLFVSFPLRASSVSVAVGARSGREVVDATVSSRGGLMLAGASSRVAFGQLTLSDVGSGRWILRSTMEGPDQPSFVIETVMTEYMADTGRFRLSGEVTLSRATANALGRPDLEQITIGWLQVDAAAGEPVVDPVATGSRGGGSPDVIVGDLNGVSSYGQSGGISAFSVGTTSCNVGTAPLNWIASTNEHPVIAQNMFRLKDGRFEQIGQSWLKHGFFALSQDLCFTDCQGIPSGTQLGIHCSDPYTAGLNGSQSNLGPRSEVNALTGSYPYPFTSPTTPPTIGRRLQVPNADLDPTLNAGASYFVEGQYVAADDAMAGNGGNNSSYRPVDVLGSEPNYTLQLKGETQREKPAIRAWADSVPGVRIYQVKVPGEGGVLWLGANAIDNGDGTFRYEYALQNLNSHESVASFAVPIATGAVVTDMGFRSPHSHSGEPFDNTPWTATVLTNEVRWETDTESVNPNANALRWGTLYSFWFVTDLPPRESSKVTVGRYRLGTTFDRQNVMGPQTDASPPSACGLVANRNVTFCLPAGTTGSTVQAFRLRSIADPTVVKWVGPPDATGYARLGCAPVFRPWGTAAVIVADRDIVPNAGYEIQVIQQGADPLDETSFSGPLLVETTPVWGDAVGSFVGGAWTPSNGVVNFNDIDGCIAAFQATPTAPDMTLMDLHDEVPNGVINFVDISHFIFAFQDLGYPFAPPSSCP